MAGSIKDQNRPQKSEQRVEAVERALTILESFSEGQVSFSLRELAEATGLYKSTILRLCASLERFHYIRKDEEGRYHLGPGLWRLGSLYRKNFAAGDQIRPELRYLTRVTGETSSFFVREGDQRLCLYRENSKKEVRHHLDEGLRLPLKMGGTGRILLAFSGARGAPYDSIRIDGYYVSLGERDPDLFSVAIPVFNARGLLAGAFSVSGLLSRYNESVRDAILQEMRSSAKRLAASLPDEET
ncbi:MAG: IclR family transcriptional regulator [Cohaesibacter sp.]|jgi:DNA-binding IclR family transcriptional regulator|nr:IclR family transcriptional regulator [Cohaesibacter sp.]